MITTASASSNRNGRDRQRELTSREPHSRFPFQYQVGVVNTGEWGPEQWERKKIDYRHSLRF
jgi:hypothetical protein